MFEVPASDIGGGDCRAPFAGLVLVGVREETEKTTSLWFVLDFASADAPLQTVRCYRSDEASFPEPELIKATRPVLIASGRAEDWTRLAAGDENAFLNSVLQGHIELGGNFPRYRRHLEWFLSSGKQMRLPEDLNAFCAGRA